MLVSTRLQQQQIIGQNRLARTPVSARASGPRTSQQKPYRASRRVSLAVSANIIFNALNQGKIALAVSQAGPYDKVAVRATLQKYIDDNAVVVFEWSTCPYCKRAKELLDSLGTKYTAVQLDLMGIEGKAMRAELAAMTERTSVPNIYISGANVGGCNDGPGVYTLNIEGRLVPMLQAAGAL
ncbi:MAG: hypothetical protein WDW36_000844 [Sanguina aurantia]